jgi:hypothetical protein
MRDQYHAATPNNMSDTTLVNPLTGLPIEDASIQSLSELVDEQAQLEEEISSMNEILKNMGARIKYLSEVLVPNKLDDLGMSSIKMANGLKVEVKPFYNCKILNEQAFAWLDENGHGGLIKTKVVQEFSRTDREKAIEFVKENPQFKFEQGIHYQTITAFTKEVYTRNETLPEEYFQVFQGRKTRLSLK